jgi:hypothetical protein
LAVLTEAQMPFSAKRRSFLRKTALSAGTVLFWNRSAWSAATQDGDPQREIEDNTEAALSTEPGETEGPGVMDSNALSLVAP